MNSPWTQYTVVRILYNSTVVRARLISTAFGELSQSRARSASFRQSPLPRDYRFHAMKHLQISPSPEVNVSLPVGTVSGTLLDSGVRQYLGVPCC